MLRLTASAAVRDMTGSGGHYSIGGFRPDDRINSPSVIATKNAMTKVVIIDTKTSELSAPSMSRPIK